MILITLHIIRLSLYAMKKSASLYGKRGAWYSDHGTPFVRVNALLCSRETIKKYISRQGGLNLFGQESMWANKKYPHWRKLGGRAKKGIGHLTRFPFIFPFLISCSK